MVYETSKISLEQIDEMYERVDFAWNSKKFEPSWSFIQLRDDGFVDSGIPPADHELQPSQTGSTETSVSTIQTAHSTEPTTTTNQESGSDEDKAIRDMGLANVDFSY